MLQPTEVSYAQNSHKQQNSHTLTHTILFGKIIQTSPNLIIKDKKIQFRATYQDFNSNKKRGYLWRIYLLSISSKLKSQFYL